MNNYQLVISPAARDDLRNIYHFGLRTWGRSRSYRSLDHLKDQLLVLTSQPLMGAERPELLSDMRSFPVESHVIFYRTQAIQIEIVRVLHGRQDPHRYIK